MAPSHVQLSIRALFVKIITYIFSVLDRYASLPKPPQPATKLKVRSTISRQKGSFDLLIYNPSEPLPGKKRPVLINFHGGGWIFGIPQMDARWASRVIGQGIVFVSVGYRLAPRYPYPTPIDDCVDAVPWVHAHAGEYNLDRNRIALSGFSAGGNMVFAAAMRLCEDGRLANGLDLAGIISFYPLLDRSITDEQKYLQNPAAAEKTSTPASWNELFRLCYLGSGPVDLESLYLSPGLASASLLQTSLPRKLALFTCGWDRLLNEGEAFRQRLTELDEVVGGRIIPDVTHAWDRLPTYNRGSPKMDEMYTEAVAILKDFFS